MRAEADINRAISKRDGGDNQEWKEVDLRHSRDEYKEAISESGEESTSALLSLFCLAMALKKSHRSVECVRALTRLARIVPRIYGPEHEFTEDINALLEEYQSQKVVVWSRRGEQVVECTGEYKGEGEDKYVL